MFQTARGQWRSLYHWKRRVTGHNGFVPEPIARLHRLASPVLGDQFIERLVREFPVRYLLLDLEALSEERREWALQERLPELSRWLLPVERVAGVLVLRVLNGGDAGVVRRTFPRRMVAGTMRISLDRESLLGSTVRRLMVRIDGVDLEPIRVGRRGALDLEVPPADRAELVEIVIRASPREAAPLRIRTIRFLHDDGSIYP